MDPQQNPYAPPGENPSQDQPRQYSPAELRRLLEADDPRAESLRIRRLYIGLEAMIRTVGLVYCIGAWLMVVGLVGSILQMVWFGRLHSVGIVLMLIFIGLAVLFFKLGYGLRDLRYGPMKIAGVLAGLDVAAAMLLAVLAGNAIVLAHLPFDLMVLYLIGSPQTSVVFSDRYKQARQDTPDARYPAGPILLTFVVFALSMLGPFVLAMMLQPNDLPWSRLTRSASAAQERFEDHAEGDQSHP